MGTAQDLARDTRATDHDGCGAPGFDSRHAAGWQLGIHPDGRLIDQTEQRLARLDALADDELGLGETTRVRCGQGELPIDTAA